MELQNTAASATPFNVADFEARDTAWLDVMDIKGNDPLLFNGQPVRIEIYSPGTKQAVRAQHKVDMLTTARTFAGMRGKPMKETAEDKIEQEADRLTMVTATIENFPISAKELYSNPKLGYITDQVNKFHADWANF